MGKTERIERDMSGMEVAVIGDVHGTTKFLEGYEHILKHNNHVGKIIVMGDHFDPYEDIPFKTMVERYEEFIKCMKSDDRIVSLLGNHDLSAYVIHNDSTNRTAYIPSHAEKISELIGSNLGESRIMFTMGNHLFSHAGVTAQWMLCVAEPAGYNFEILNKKGWTPGELSSIVSYSPRDYSGWGNDTLQGPTWVRPPALHRDPYANFDQVVGHTMVCIKENRDFMFGSTEFNIRVDSGFYRLTMSNGRTLWFTDNEGRPEYLVIRVD